MDNKSASKKWSDENVATLLATVGTSVPVSVELVTKAAEALGVSTRSVAAKLRNLDMQVASMAVEKTARFTDSESAELRSFVEANSGVYTYKEISENFRNGQFTPKEVQGKVLALELTGSVRAADKIVTVGKYTEAEEARFVKLVEAGKFIEDIAEDLNKTIASVRGKALSLLRKNAIAAIPAQKETHAKADTDPVAALGDSVLTMTVAELAEKTGKTERGLKTLLTRRGINIADYKGADKAAKNAEKAAA